MSFNKNTWDKDYTGAPGLKKIGKPGASVKPTTTKKEASTDGK